MGIILDPILGTLTVAATTTSLPNQQRTDTTIPSILYWNEPYFCVSPRCDKCRTNPHKFLWTILWSPRVSVIGGCLFALFRHWCVCGAIPYNMSNPISTTTIDARLYGEHEKAIRPNQILLDGNVSGGKVSVRLSKESNRNQVAQKESKAKRIKPIPNPSSAKHWACSESFDSILGWLKIFISESIQRVETQGINTFHLNFRFIHAWKFYVLSAKPKILAVKFPFPLDWSLSRLEDDFFQLKKWHFVYFSSEV